MGDPDMLLSNSVVAGLKLSLLSGAALADLNKLAEYDLGAGTLVSVAVDPTAGFVTFAVAPGIGAIRSAVFEFDVPVRFDTDRIQTSVASFQAGEVPNVPIIEVRV